MDTVVGRGRTRVTAFVTLVSSDAAYGGPVSVALNQLREFHRRGCKVTLVCGYRHGDRPAREIDGIRLVRCRIYWPLPRLGFASMLAPLAWLYVLRCVAAREHIIVHLARDLVTMPTAFLATLLSKKVLVQTHGMIDQSVKRGAALLDVCLTRPVLARAYRALALTDREELDLLDLGASPDRVVRIINGISVTTIDNARGRQEVLYLARLAARKRPLDFVEMARTLAREFPSVRFSLIGPDEGQGQAVVDAIQSSGVPEDRLGYEGPIEMDHVRKRLGAAAVYVLPAVNEIFPMTVLEAMERGVPVVVTSDNGLAEQLLRHDAGVVVQPTVPDLVSAVRNVLSDPDQAMELGLRGRALVEREWSIQRVVDDLERYFGFGSPTQKS
jgi:glycosyltransferase involved in cell wall biosynthesis